MVVSEAEEGTSGNGKFLPTILSVCHSPEWWMDTGANIHVCADASLFSSYQVGETGALLMGNGSQRVFLVLVWHSEVHFGKDGAVEELAACPLHKKESS